MGNAEVKERFERAEKSKILTANGLELSNWEKLTNRLATLSGLRTITLSENKLEGRIPRAFLSSTWFATLKVLDLQKNKITDITCLSPWPSLLLPNSDASSANGDLMSIQRALLAGIAQSIPELKEKDLGAAVDRLIDDEMGAKVAAALADAPNACPRFPSLETLQLSDNQLATIPPLLLFTFPKLKKLLLARNRLVSVGFAHLAFSDELVVLDLEGNRIADGGAVVRSGAYGVVPGAACTPLSKLEQLSLAKNAIVDFHIGGEPTLRLAKLRVLDLAEQSGSGLTSVSPEIFAVAPQVNDIVIRGSRCINKIVDAWKADAVYREWELTHADVVSKQISGGAETKLMH